MRIALTGSHGLIGSALTTSLLAQGHEVIAISRGVATTQAEPVVAGLGSVSQSDQASTRVFFDPDGGQSELSNLGFVDAFVHLAGEPIGSRRWDAQLRSRIYASRVYGTRSLVQALASLPHPPATLIVASAAGFYGDRGDEELTETSTQGSGFLAKVVGDWEAEAIKATEFAERVVVVRTGLVLSRQGGLMARLLPLFRAGLGGKLASGEQYMSWITLDDEVRAIEHALFANVSGPINLVAPNPVRNREFTQDLARSLHRPAVFRVPRGALEFALGREMARELVLVSQRIVPEALISSEFVFQSPTLDVALRELLG